MLPSLSMDELFTYLQRSIEDEVFSKNEKRDFKSMLQERHLDQQQLALLRNKIYELAETSANERNYTFILQWVKTALGALEHPMAAAPASAAFFSPGDACRNAINHQIESAIRQLKICVFTISDDAITSRLLTAKRKGVEIKIITDDDKSFDEGSDIAMLAAAGIAVKMDNSPNHMHHKFMVADQRTLITGSYNWTRSAARFNHENVLLTQEAELVKTFTKQFDQLWQSMDAYSTQ